MAMSSLTGSSPDTIPKPAKSFKAVFIDQMDVTTEVRDVTIEGGVFVEGKVGEGTVTVAFDKMSEMTPLMRDGRLWGNIKLRDGNTVEIVLNKTHRAYGRTPYGTFQIRLSDVKKMKLLH
ncbi:MAG TPA: hypothetical protein PK836_01575 [Syntrophales bacterium]|nr:hypothetical protein [Syntrophales bacterium]